MNELWKEIVDFAHDEIVDVWDWVDTAGGNASAIASAFRKTKISCRVKDEVDTKEVWVAAESLSYEDTEYVTITNRGSVAFGIYLKFYVCLDDKIFSLYSTSLGGEQYGNSEGYFVPLLHFRNEGEIASQAAQWNETAFEFNPDELPKMFQGLVGANEIVARGMALFGRSIAVHIFTKGFDRIAENADGVFEAVQAHWDNIASALEKVAAD